MLWFLRQKNLYVMIFIQQEETYNQQKYLWQQEEACGVGYQEERVDGECQDINECLTGFNSKMKKTDNYDYDESQVGS